MRPIDSAYAELDASRARVRLQLVDYTTDQTEKKRELTMQRHKQ
jgi:hypothetical protein